MKIYVYLDESGSIHKNSKTAFFAVGGYFILSAEKIKTIAIYKRINKRIKLNRNIELKKELKSYHLKNEEKINIISKIQNVDSFYGGAKIFNKTAMKKEIVESNIFFNYSVKLFFIDCVIPLLKSSCFSKPLEFVVSVDNRNIRTGELNNLEHYLNTEFNEKKISYKVTYYDSSSNYGIQLADLIVNTFYNEFKDKSIVNEVLPFIKKKKFRISVFPGCIIIGRKAKIGYNSI